MPSASPAYSYQPTNLDAGNAGIPEGYAANPAFGATSGQLFEASLNQVSSVGGPTYYAPPQQPAPAYGKPHFDGVTDGGVVQHEVNPASPATQYWMNEAACGPQGCGPKAGPTYSTPASRWFAGVNALIMTRSQENNVWLSYNTNDIRQRILTTHDANAFYSGGVETRFGRYFGCGSSGLEVVYWGIYPGVQEANVLASGLAIGDLDTILHFDGISYNPGPGPPGPPGTQLVSSAFFQADRHRLRRDYNLQNIELNLFETNFGPMCGGPNLNLTWAAGLRYVKFDESFLYSTDPADTTFSGAPEEIHYGIDTRNNLIGLQIGGRASMCIKPGFTSFIGTKVGLFANRSSQHSQIFGSNGFAEVSDPVSPYLGTPLDIRANKTSTAFVAEMRAGLNYQFTPCWSGTIGYRAIGLTGVALSTNQIPVDFIGAIDSLRTVNTNGCLIAHGAFVGLNYCY